MNEEILNKLKNILSELTLKYTKDLESYEQVDKEKLSESVQQFLDIYNKTETIHLPLLKTFFLELPIKEETTIESIQSLLTYLDFCIKNNNNGMFEFDIEQCRLSIKNLITEINKFYMQLLQQIRKNVEEKRIIQEKVDSYNHICNTIEFYEQHQFLPKAQYDTICNFLINNKELIEPQEINELIKDITKSNADYMYKKIQIEIIKQKKLQEQKQILEEQQKEERLKRISETEEVIKPENSPQSNNEKSEAILEQETNEEQQNESIKQVLTEQQLIVYENAKKIANQVLEINSSIRVAITSLNLNITWEDRTAIYESLSNKDDLITLIALDIQKNLLPSLENNSYQSNYLSSLFSQLENAVKYYKTVMMPKKVEQEERIPTIKKLRNRDITQNEELDYDIDELIRKCLELKQELPQVYYASNMDFLIQVLQQKQKDYIDCKEEYLSNGQTEEDAELMNISYEEVLESLQELKNHYNEIIYKKPDKREDLIKKAQTFYQSASPLKNIYIFVGDDNSVTSCVEEDIEEDKYLDSKAYEGVIKKLGECISDDFVATGNHKVKDDKHYSDDFLEKYHVKSINNGDTRIFYSRFRTNLGELYNTGNLHAIFIYSVGFGKGNGTAKKDINYTALRRCYKNRQQIDYYLTLFNTDWKLLPSQERQALEREVNDYLNNQFVKLGHLLTTCEEKKLACEREGAVLHG